MGINYEFPRISQHWNCKSKLRSHLPLLKRVSTTDWAPSLVSCFLWQEAGYVFLPGAGRCVEYPQPSQSQPCKEETAWVTSRWQYVCKESDTTQRSEPGSSGLTSKFDLWGNILMDWNGRNWMRYLSKMQHSLGQPLFPDTVSQTPTQASSLWNTRIYHSHQGDLFTEDRKAT